MEDDKNGNNKTNQRQDSNQTNRNTQRIYIHANQIKEPKQMKFSIYFLMHSIACLGMIYLLTKSNIDAYGQIVLLVLIAYEYFRGCE